MKVRAIALSMVSWRIQQVRLRYLVAQDTVSAREDVSTSRSTQIPCTFDTALRLQVTSFIKGVV